MLARYVVKALEIFREKGSIELSKRLARFLTRFILYHPLKRLDPHYYYRFKFQTWKNDLQNEIKYDAPPDPFQPIFIKAKEVPYRKKSDRIIPKYTGLGKIKKGDWDSTEYDKSVEKLATIRYFSERFEDNKNQEETQDYNMILRELKQNKKYENWNYETAEELVSEYCDNYDELYEEISKIGYTKNHEGTRISPMSNYPHLRDCLEVLVVIDAKGKIHLWDGHHRFGIARVLDLEIPANVLCRHKQWQELRDEIYNNGLSGRCEDLRDHPDLQDVID